MPSDSPLSHPKPGWLLALGILYIFAGLFGLLSPMLVGFYSIMLLGFLLLAAGGVTVIHSFWTHGWDGFAVQLLTGILAAVSGFFLVVDAQAGAAVITILLASYFLVSGFFRVSFALTHLRSRRSGPLLLSGIITVLLGILITVHWPSSGLWLIGVFVGVDLLFYGISLITFARAAK